MLREGVLDLADGRRLGYAEIGQATAPAVVYCHGFPGSRRELHLSQSVLESQGVPARVVALNRPGYGPSTFRATRSFLDWPGDVAEVADRLSIGRFAVVGASGGCPFALACGYVLGDRVTRIGIVVGTAPPEAPGMKEAPGIAAVSSSLLLRRLQFGMMARAINTGRSNRVMEEMRRTMGEADQRAFEEPAVQEWFMDVMRDAFSQGGRAAAHEGGLYRIPWGFELDSLTPETLLWYGGEDKTVPASAGAWLADHIPDSHYVLWPQHGHFTWPASDQVAEVIAAVTA